jgi:glycosyltransferase involved in cell wall biosynthesis
MVNGGIIFKPPGMGGAERYVAFLSNIFDVPVHVLYSDVDHEQWIDGDSVEEFGAKRSLPLLGRRVGGAFIDRMEYAFWKPPKDYDVVFSSGLISKPTVHYPHQSRIHLAIGYHAGAFGIPPRDTFSSNSVIELWQKMNRLILRDQERSHLERADVVVAQSQPTADAIEFYHGVTPDAVINPPVDTDTFYSDRPSEEDFYLYIGGLHIYKYVDQVVEAFNSLPHNLVVAGDGAQRDELEARAGENVEFLGYVSEQKKRELLATCSGVLQNHEFGVATVEALASGAPVIAVDHHNIREKQVLHHAAYSADIIEDGINGLYYPDSTGPSHIREAIERAEGIDWEHGAIQATAEPYTHDAIEADWKEVLEAVR